MNYNPAQLGLDLGDERVLLQMKLRDEPWRMLVGCILLNLTSRLAVEHVIWTLFERWPDAAAMAAADPVELEATLRPLGLQETRAWALVFFSRQWVGDSTLRPISRHYFGCGPYAQDSWDIFQEGLLPDPPPSGDWALTAYVDEAVRGRPVVVVGSRA